VAEWMRRYRGKAESLSRQVLSPKVYYANCVIVAGFVRTFEKRSFQLSVLRELVTVT
jgi:hypothetical protein